MWIAKIRVENEFQDKLLEVCEDIKSKDKSFKYKMKKEKDRMYLLVSGKDKNQAFKRASWMINKVEVFGKTLSQMGYGYNVKWRPISNKTVK